MFSSSDIPSARYALCPLLIALPIRNWFNFPPPSYLLSFPTSAFRLPSIPTFLFSHFRIPTSDFLTPSHRLIFFLSHLLTLSFSHLLSFPPSHRLTFFLSHLLTVSSSFFPTFSPSHLLTFFLSHLLTFSPSFFPTFSPSHLLIFFLFRLPHSDFRLLSRPRIALISLKTYDWLWGADSLPVD
jgi:hypothetical protein